MHPQTARWAPAILLVLSCAAWAAPPTYQVTQLPDGFQPIAINNNGTILGRSVSGPAFYEAGQITALAGLNASTSVYDLNDVGQVVGGGFLWSAGSIRGLGFLPSSINNSGWVAGTQSGPGEEDFSAVLFDGTTTHNIGALMPGGSGAQRSYGAAINEAGHVAGWGGGETADVAFLYADGVVRTFALEDGGPGSYTTAMNNRGQVVGTTYGNCCDAFLYDNGSLSSLYPNLGHADFRPVAVNDSGQIIAHAMDFAFYYGTSIYDAGTWYDLSNYLAPASSDLYMIETYDLNNAGQILAKGVSRDRVDEFGIVEEGSPEWYFVLTPVPEPRSYALMIAGLALLAMLGALRRRGDDRGAQAPSPGCT